MLKDLPFVHFQDHDPTPEELQRRWIDMQDDLYAPLLQGVEWQRGGGKGRAEEAR
jgi:hypothetical protein